MKRTLQKLTFSILSIFLLVSCERELHIVTTGDVHGAWFAESFVSGDEPKTSLESVKWAVDSLRKAVGKRNVLLLDCGDCLQGTNAPYYFNYIAASEPHLFPRIAKYLGYDAVVVGNHDIETGHPVYDRVAAQMKQLGIPWLYANAVKPDGTCYFKEYAVFRKAGKKVLVLGFGNANIKAWLQNELWEGMDFKSLVPFVQEEADRIKAEVKPDITVVVMHSGTGEGDGKAMENQSLDVMKSVKGVDVLFGAHDHRPCAIVENGVAYVDGGARAANIGHVVIGKEILAETIQLDKEKVDPGMREAFDKEFQAIKAFTNKKIGSLDTELRSQEAYVGMNSYVNLLQTVQMQASGASVSFSSPLSFNGIVKAGELIYNDLFTIYPFENQLFVMNLTGKEIKNYLEFSYDGWIVTPGDHVLKIQNAPDKRTGATKWSFIGRPYNFDSAAGINYTVNVTKAFGSRVSISSMADGTPFDENKTYAVAITSYRASGGGDLLEKGAGIHADELQSRIVGRYPEIRELIYKYLQDNGGELKKETFGNLTLLGSWSFEPKAKVEPLMQSDLNLIF